MHGTKSASSSYLHHDALTPPGPRSCPLKMKAVASVEVVIAGAGIIGLSLALELRRRGLKILLLAPEIPGYASIAAAGMLAAHDPINPPELQPMADLSLRLYPGFLSQIRGLTGTLVPVETEYVLEADTHGGPGTPCLPALTTDQPFTLRPEQSLDPRKLLPALRQAVLIAGATFEPAQILKTSSTGEGLQLHTTAGLLATNIFIDCTGTWAPPSHVRPAKGQMLRLQLPPNTLRHATHGNLVLRTREIYIVPRLDGTALLGATVEDAGFTTHTTAAGLQQLRGRAATLLPAVADAVELESWAGLRPPTADRLPIVGRLHSHHYLATGHFRNGILLAPATARLMAQLISGEIPEVDLSRFSPDRYTTTPAASLIR